MQVQNTPSVYFHFEDSLQNSNSNDEYLLQLSCTNQKLNQLDCNDKQRPTPMDLYQSIEVGTLKEYSKIKTEQFFQEFDNHFVVTFQQDSKPAFQQTHSDPIVKAADGNHNQQNQPQIDSPEQMQKTNISCQPLQKNNSNSQVFRENLISSDIIGMVKKDKESPIPSFQVKKRTTFKNRENLVSNANNFKITKKKLINQNTLEIFGLNRIFYPSDQFAISCGRAKKCLTSRVTHKESKEIRRVSKLQETNYTLQKNGQTIFELKNSNINLRSTTLDYWKRRFQMSKKQLQKKSVQTGHIFTKTSSFR